MDGRSCARPAFWGSRESVFAFGALDQKERGRARSMFDSVLGHGTVAKSRFGTGAVLSVLLHVGVLGLAIYLSSRPAKNQEKDISVVLKLSPRPSPLRQRRAPTRRRRRRRRTSSSSRRRFEGEPAGGRAGEEGRGGCGRGWRRRRREGRRGGGRGGRKPWAGRDRDPGLWGRHEPGRSWPPSPNGKPAPDYTSEARQAAKWRG